jgi:cyanophycinase-like exopeptidase
MAELEAALIAGRPSRYVQLATAAGMEGPGSIDRWTALGAAQAARLGVEAVPVKALDRESAEDAANAEQVRGAGLIYLSGGNPSYLADTLRETLVWAAIVEEWLKGAALAGCSAGAMALTGWVPNIRRPEAEPRAGLGTVPKLWVLPHFDRLKEWAPRTAEVVAAQVPAGMTLIGIDEETAIVSDGNDLSRWVVHGRQSVWASGPDGWESFRAGAEVRV